jgi:hypothetical protein
VCVCVCDFYRNKLCRYTVQMHKREILVRKDFYELTFCVNSHVIFYDLNSHCNPGRTIGSNLDLVRALRTCSY